MSTVALAFGQLIGFWLTVNCWTCGPDAVVVVVVEEDVELVDDDVLELVVVLRRVFDAFLSSPPERRAMSTPMRIPKMRMMRRIHQIFPMSKPSSSPFLEPPAPRPPEPGAPGPPVYPVWAGRVASPPVGVTGIVGSPPGGGVTGTGAVGSFGIVIAVPFVGGDGSGRPAST